MENSPAYKNYQDKRVKNEAELTLMILECYMKDGPSLSIEDLCIKTKVSEKKVKDILLVLEKRGYLIKTKKPQKYRFSKKIVMLI